MNLKTCLRSILLVSLISCNSVKNDPVMESLSNRVLKDKSNNFLFHINKKKHLQDEFTINSNNNKVIIEGNNRIALASGLKWYINNKANSQITWEATNLDFPNTLPKIDFPIKKKASFEYSYYLNYCTYSYSMAFWDWPRWEEEIDLMAMRGINLPLAMNGIEAVWRNTLLRLNCSKEEIDQFIPGPAFNAWWLMGNLEGWGGPLSDTYIDQQAELQKKILNRMKELDMKPVVPGFFGMVPTYFKEKYPNADIRDQGLWAGGFQRPAFLSPTDPLFIKISKIYYEELKKLYGNIQYFSGDPFHEGGSSKGINLPNAGEKLVHAMRASFPDSKWVFQGWQHNPSPMLIKNIPSDEIIILDLDCDNRPQWEERNGWNGKPWVWSMITNFGGNVGMFGRMDIIAKEPFRALHHEKFGGNLCGIGAMMEGIDNNSVIYDLLFDVRWHRKPIDLDKWLNTYIKSRYGKLNQDIIDAWQVLRKTVYGKELLKNSSQQGTTESYLCARPSLNIKSVSTWGSSDLYYNPKELLPAWKIFIENKDNFITNEGYKYDLVDITRQCLSNYSQYLHQQITTAFHNKDKEKLTKYTKEFLQLILDQDQLLSTIPSLTLDHWIKNARDRGTFESEKDLFEFNAKTQITTWSFKDSNLHEYSHREWAGLLREFYYPRWNKYFDYLLEKISNKHTQKPNFFPFEEKWTRQIGVSTLKSKTTPYEVSEKVYNKYYSRILNSYNN
ncbi:alpha-N-acetylglucosaminidase [Halosquirtibacter xylanolyticus]|uniref:alpha-N-acetylglucosaminidase n=1 Tax=Halosquirtibacter xylanolyticus TaxID=3374599 RepID=UPI00374A6019|nr:alpha-N-acetylglucosaminidase [Prolixibacteraceae bacterium]